MVSLCGEERSRTGRRSSRVNSKQWVGEGTASAETPTSQPLANNPRFQRRFTTRLEIVFAATKPLLSVKDSISLHKDGDIMDTCSLPENPWTLRKLAECRRGKLADISSQMPVTATTKATAVAWENCASEYNRPNPPSGSKRLPFAGRIMDVLPSPAFHRKNVNLDRELEKNCCHTSSNRQAAYQKNVQPVNTAAQHSSRSSVLSTSELDVTSSQKEVGPEMNSKPAGGLSNETGRRPESLQNKSRKSFRPDQNLLPGAYLGRQRQQWRRTDKDQSSGVRSFLSQSFYLLKSTTLGFDIRRSKKTQKSEEVSQESNENVGINVLLTEAKTAQAIQLPTSQSAIKMSASNVNSNDEHIQTFSLHTRSIRSDTTNSNAGIECQAEQLAQSSHSPTNKVLGTSPENKVSPTIFQPKRKISSCGTTREYPLHTGLTVFNAQPFSNNAYKPCSSPVQKPGSPNYMWFGGSPAQKPKSPNYTSFGGSPVQKPESPNYTDLGGSPVQKPVSPNYTGFSGSLEEKPVSPNYMGFSGSPVQKPKNPNYTGFGGSPVQKPESPNYTGLGGSPVQKPVSPNYMGFSNSLVQKPKSPNYTGFGDSPIQKPESPNYTGLGGSPVKKPASPNYTGFSGSPVQKPKNPNYTGFGDSLIQKPESPNYTGLGGSPVQKPVSPNYMGFSNSPVQKPKSPNYTGFGDSPIQKPESPNYTGLGGSPIQKPKSPNYTGFGNSPIQKPESPNYTGLGGSPIQKPESPNYTGLGGSPVKKPASPNYTRFSGFPVQKPGNQYYTVLDTSCSQLHKRYSDEKPTRLNSLPAKVNQGSVADKSIFEESNRHSWHGAREYVKMHPNKMCNTKIQEWLGCSCNKGLQTRQNKDVIYDPLKTKIATDRGEGRSAHGPCAMQLPNRLRISLPSARPFQTFQRSSTMPQKRSQMLVSYPTYNTLASSHAYREMSLYKEPLIDIRSGNKMESLRSKQDAMARCKSMDALLEFGDDDSTISNAVAKHDKVKKISHDGRHLSLERKSTSHFFVEQVYRTSPPGGYSSRVRSYSGSGPHCKSPSLADSPGAKHSPVSHDVRLSSADFLAKGWITPFASGQLGCQARCQPFGLSVDPYTHLPNHSPHNTSPNLTDCVSMADADDVFYDREDSDGDSNTTLSDEYYLHENIQTAHRKRRVQRQFAIIETAV